MIFNQNRGWMYWSTQTSTTQTGIEIAKDIFVDDECIQTFFMDIWINSEYRVYKCIVLVRYCLVPFQRLQWWLIASQSSVPCNHVVMSTKVMEQMKILELILILYLISCQYIIMLWDDMGQQNNSIWQYCALWRVESHCPTSLFHQYIVYATS